MNEFGVDYKGFDNAISTVKTTQNDLELVKSDYDAAKKILSNDSYFMGDIADSLKIDVYPSFEKSFEAITKNLTTVSEYMGKVRDAYRLADKDSEDIMTSVGKISLINEDGLPISSLFGGRDLGYSTSIPAEIWQSGYVVTCYEEDGWHIGASYDPTAITPGSSQEAVHDAWVKGGAKYKDGIAVLNVDGTDCYLVATSSTFGDVGDVVNVNLDNGDTIPCVIADQKNSQDSNYTEYGHLTDNGTTNVLEFEVDTDTYRSNGYTNPTTSGWGLEWNSSSAVSSIDNYGSVI